MRKNISRFLLLIGMVLFATCFLVCVNSMDIEYMTFEEAANVDFRTESDADRVHTTGDGTNIEEDKDLKTDDGINSDLGRYHTLDEGSNNDSGRYHTLDEESNIEADKKHNQDEESDIETGKNHDMAEGTSADKVRDHAGDDDPYIGSTVSSDTDNENDEGVAADIESCASDTKHYHSFVYDTSYIYHKEQGHTENICVQEAYTEDIYEYYAYCCKQCGVIMDEWDSLALADHVLLHGAYGNSYVIVDTVYHEARYQDVWIVDREAYTEKITVKKCSQCGYIEQ